MKIVAIGDIHGNDCWEKITNKESDCDKVVFLGDYFDSFHIPSDIQIVNFKSILEYKKANMDKVVLLFGNHDFHYLKNVNETYSGYQNVFSYDISNLIHKAINDRLIQMCYVNSNFIFTHAGVTKTWMNNVSKDYQYNISKDYYVEYYENNIESFINDLFIYQPYNNFKFTMGKNYSQTGDDFEQSPIWVRPNSLIYDSIDNFIQVVGHTTQNNININNDNNIILIDTLETSKEYLIIEDGVPYVSKI